MITATYLNSPEARRVATKYAAWRETDEGLDALMRLGVLVIAQIIRPAPPSGFKTVVKTVARRAGLPFNDVLVMAKGQYELIRCGMIATGQLPASVGELVL